MIKKLALLATTLLVLFGCLEIFARLALRTPPRLLEQDSTIGIRYRKGFSGDVFVEEAGREVYLRFNRDGFRDRDYPDEAAIGVNRIAVLGDSFIAAIATDEGKTMVRLLENRLEELRPDVDFEVMNFGVSSSSTGQELLLYREIVRRYRPAVVLCFFAVLNDFADNSSRLSGAQRLYFDFDEYGELELGSRSNTRSESRNWLNRHSTFYRWQRAALKTVRYRALETAEILKPGRWIYSTRLPASEDLLHGWRLTEQLVTTLADEVAHDGAKFVLVILPSPEQIYSENWNRMIEIAGEAGAFFDADYPARRLSDLGARESFPVFDLTATFREEAPQASVRFENEWLYFRARGHCNDRGNRVAADAVARWLDGFIFSSEALEEDSGTTAMSR